MGIRTSVYPRRNTCMKLVSFPYWPSFVCVTAALLMVVAQGSPTSAQSPFGKTSGQSSSPYQQRLSPYLNLLRNDNSTLNPYHAFVQPRQQIQQNIVRQGIQLQRLNQAYQSSSLGASLTTPSQNRRPTGNSGSFNNYSHFYPTHR